MGKLLQDVYGYYSFSKSANTLKYLALSSKQILLL